MSKRAKRKNNQSDLDGASQSSENDGEGGASSLGVIAEQTMVEDPLFVFLKQNWRPVLAVVAVVVAGWYMNMVFHENYVTAMRGAADVFANMRGEFQRVEDLGSKKKALTRDIAKLEQEAQGSNAQDDGSDTDKKDAKGDNAEASPKQALEKKRAELSKVEEDYSSSRSRLLEFLRALDDQKEPYSRLSQLYRGLLSLNEGDNEKAIQFLGQLKWQQIDPSAGSERFISEMASLRLSRLLLDLEGREDEGRTMLKSLAEKGVHANIGASLALAKSASSAEQKEEALMLLQEISAKQPEQAELLEPEVERLRG